MFDSVHPRILLSCFRARTSDRGWYSVGEGGEGKEARARESNFMASINVSNAPNRGGSRSRSGGRGGEGCKRTSPTKDKGTDNAEQIRLPTLERIRVLRVFVRLLRRTGRRKKPECQTEEGSEKGWEKGREGKEGRSLRKSVAPRNGSIKASDTLFPSSQALISFL